MRWIPGGGVIDMMNEYREEFSLRVALKREREGGTRCAPMHPETDNSRGSVRGPTSFQKYVRESCGEIQRGEFSAMLRVASIHAHSVLFMSEYSEIPRCPLSLRRVTPFLRLPFSNTRPSARTFRELTLTCLPPAEDVGGEGDIVVSF